MIEVIDDFMPEEHAKKMYDTMIGPDFSWYITLNVAKKHVESNDYYFTHLFYDNGINSDYYEDFIKPISDKLNARELIRVKGNMYTNQNKFIEHVPHIDYDFEHKGAIYCLNTCNGHTNFMGEKIDSIFNRMILFNPNVLHNSTTTTDKIVRMNINFNYFENDR
tara:strand:- start:402 stop:893 length:492 start_codon:yes stop_codon:yes gene_type:complete